MADEQTIYLSPEDELTSVLERLSSIQARRIILVIPQQTLLRSHVGWRLIHARMREQKKELWVISTDRKIRAVASAAGFKVAETQESPSNRPRLGGGTRPGNVNTRGSGRSRVGGSRGGTQESQPPPSRRQFTPNASNRPLTRPSAFGSNAGYEEEGTLQHSQKPEREPGSSQVAPAMYVEEQKKHFNPPYDFRISTTPSVRPSVPQIEEDEEEDIEYGDYDTAQTIRKAAAEGGNLPKGQRRQEKNPVSNWGDPYDAFNEDEQLAPLPEQRGSAPGPKEDEPLDISDMSTEVMLSEIEDLGDQGAVIDLPEIQQPRRPGPPVGQPREQGGWRPKSGQIAPPPPQRGSPRAPRPGFDLEDDEEPLPEIPPHGFAGTRRPSSGLAGAGQRPSQSLQPGQRASQGLKSGASQRPSQSLQPGQRASQGLKSGASQRPSQAPQPGQRASQGLRPGASQRPSQSLQPGQSKRPSQSLAQNPRGAQQAPLGTRPRTGPAQRSRQPLVQSRQPSTAPQKQRRGNRVLAFVFVVVALLLLAGGLIFYLVPSATVTISLQAKTLTQQVKLNATTDPQAQVEHKVLATTLQQDFSASGEGTANGTVEVGNAKAQGSVSFTNNSQTNLIIPTGTILQTPDGIQFVTDAEAVAPAQDTLTFVPISAQQAGKSGNVNAGTITVIPQASLTNIARRNGINAADLSATTLVVTNNDATSKGGATTQSAVTAQDRENLAQALHLKLQQAVKNWQKQQTQNGNMLGKLIPDITASEKPLPEEQLSGVPAEKQPVPNKKFSGSLSVHIKVLVAQASALQAAAGTQLNAAALKMNPASTLASQLPITFTNVKSTPSKDGTSLAITATANGQIITQIDLVALSNNLTSKGIDQAKETLQTGPMAQAGVRNVDIKIFPSVLNFLPLRASQIQVVLKPISAAPPTNVSNS